MKPLIKVAAHVREGCDSLFCFLGAWNMNLYIKLKNCEISVGKFEIKD